MNKNIFNDIGYFAKKERHVYPWLSFLIRENISLGFKKEFAKMTQLRNHKTINNLSPICLRHVIPQTNRKE